MLRSEQGGFAVTVRFYIVWGGILRSLQKRIGVDSKEGGEDGDTKHWSGPIFLDSFLFFSFYKDRCYLFGIGMGM